MKPFDEDAACPKCRNAVVHSGYIMEDGHEAVERKCARCSYGWDEACLDADADPTPPLPYPDPVPREQVALTVEEAELMQRQRVYVATSASDPHIGVYRENCGWLCADGSWSALGAIRPVLDTFLSALRAAVAACRKLEGEK